MAGDAEAIIAASRTAAESYAALAKSALEDAIAASKGYTNVVVGDFTWSGSVVLPTFDYYLNTFNDTYTKPTNTAVLPDFVDIYIPELPEIPDPPVIDTSGLFLFTPPDINVNPFNGDVPTIDLQDFFDEMDALTPPTIVQYEEPTLHTDILPEYERPNLPVFDKDPSIYLPCQVPDLEAKFKDAFDTMLPYFQNFIIDGVNTWIATFAPSHTENFALLEAKLKEGMESGTALPEQYDAALRNYARREIDRNHDAQVESVLNDNARAGFYTAPGAVVAGLMRLKTTTGSDLAKMNTDVYIKRREQEIQHIQFCLNLEASMQTHLFSMMMQYAGMLNDINKTAISYATSLVESIAKQWALMYERSRLEMEIFKLEIATYETRLKSALAILDVYRLEIEQAKLTLEIDRTAVDIWAKKWDVQIKQIEAYIEQIKIVIEKANLSKLAVEIFTAQIQAYVAELQAKKLQVDVYVAAMEGDEAKLKGLLAPLEIYTETVKAFQVQAQVEIAHSEAINANNRNLAAIYAAELDAYRAEISGETARFDGSVKSYMTLLDGYRATNDVKLRALQADLEVLRLNYDAAKTSYETSWKTAVKNAELFMQHIEIMAKTAEGVGDQYSGMSQSALSGLNTMVSSAITATA